MQLLACNLEVVAMSVQARKEMATRLSVIVKAARAANADVIAGNLSHIRKQLDEIRQYEQSCRIDLEYLLSLKEG